MKIEDSGAFELSRVGGVAPVQRIGPVFDLFASYGAPAVNAPDAAALSVQAQELDAYASQVRALPDIRADKVAALEARLAQGPYAVPMADLSEAMFRLAELDHQG